MTSRRKRKDPRLVARSREYARQGEVLVADVGREAVRLNTLNHASLDALARGEAHVNHLRTVQNAVVMARSIADVTGLGLEFRDTLTAAVASVITVRKRERPVCRGPELAAIKDAYRIHSEQLNLVTLDEMTRSIAHARKHGPALV